MMCCGMPECAVTECAVSLSLVSNRCEGPFQAVSTLQYTGTFTHAKIIVFYRNDPMFLSQGHEPFEGHESIQKGHETLDSRSQQQLSSSREVK